MDHARLMADPCQGRLVPPAYPQPGGGSIQRFRSIASFGTGAADTAVLFHWTPSTNEFVINAAVAPTTNFLPNVGTVFPNLANTTGVGAQSLSYRVIAACVRVMTNASEANRSGLIYAGQTNPQYVGINGAALTNVQTVCASLPVTSRVPSKHLEVLWSPQIGDQSFNTDFAGVNYGNGQAAPGYGSITIGASGLPPGSGLTFEITMVAEVNYVTGGSVIATPLPVTTTPWNNVLRAFGALIKYAPVIIDTARESIDYFGVAGPSYPGRNISGAAQKYITM